jgi:hypothetical protein
LELKRTLRLRFSSRNVGIVLINSESIFLSLNVIYYKMVMMPTIEKSI